MTSFISQMEPWFGPEEKRAINDYMDSGGWLTEFEKTREFESRVAEFVGSKNSVIVTSGTAALYVGLLALDIKPGDEVIVPDFTMIATPNAVKMAGAEPVFCDVSKETLCLDLNELAKKITTKTKGIIFVTLNGRSPDMFEVQKFCREKGLFLLEDAAQSLGSFYEGKHLGTFGDIGVFSFSSPKIISTGQGGALVTDSNELALKIRKIKDFGREKGGVDLHNSLGFNFKFTDLQACVGIEQMKKLNWRLKRKKEIFFEYQKNLKSVKQIDFIPTNLKNTSPWFIDCFVEKRVELINFLKLEKIQTRPVYPAISSQQIYQNKNQKFPISEAIAEKGLWLPSSSFLTNSQIYFICEKIRSFYS